MMAANLRIGESTEQIWGFHLVKDGDKSLCGHVCRESQFPLDEWDTIGSVLEKRCLVCHVKGIGWLPRLDDIHDTLNVSCHLMDLYDSLEDVEKVVSAGLKRAKMAPDIGKLEQARIDLFASAIVVLRRARRKGVDVALRDAEIFRDVLKNGDEEKQEYEKEDRRVVRDLFGQLYRNWRRRKDV